MKKTDVIPCEVVKDLLPLYLKKQIGEETRQKIEEHLSECPECAQLLGQMKGREYTPSDKFSGEEAIKARTIPGPARRNVFLSLICLLLIMMSFLFWLVPSPSDTKEMKQVLIKTEELNYCTGKYESSDGTTSSLSEESRVENIQEFNAKVAQYCSSLGRPYDEFQETHEDLINRVNIEIPQVYRIDHWVAAKGLPIAYYQNDFHREARMTLRLSEMGLSVVYDNNLHCWNVRFGYWNPKCQALFIKENNAWKILEIDRPNEYVYNNRHDEQRLIRLLGRKTVEQIRKVTQKQYDTFAEARSEAERLQQLVFSSEQSSMK